MKIFNVFFILLISSTFLIGSTPKILTGVIVGVTDGDTVKLLTPHKDLFKIRLADIDAPEKKQAFGKKSKYFLSDLIYKKIVTVQVKTKDKWGRLIGTIYLNKQNINYAMVEAGLAWVYRRYSHDKHFLELEASAQYHKRGLWIDPNPIKPSLYRKGKR